MTKFIFKMFFELLSLALFVGMIGMWILLIGGKI